MYLDDLELGSPNIQIKNFLTNCNHMVYDDGSMEFFNVDNGIMKQSDIDSMTRPGKSVVSLQLGSDIIQTYGTETMDDSMCNAICTTVTSVDMSLCTNLTAIGYRTFYNCSKLTELVFPENLNTVYSYAFRFCSSLEKVVFNSMIPTSRYIPDTYEEWGIASNAFADVPSTTKVYFMQNTRAELESMYNYPFGLATTSIIASDEM